MGVDKFFLPVMTPSWLSALLPYLFFLVFGRSGVFLGGEWVVFR